jgi:hypothetical protein
MHSPPVAAISSMTCGKGCPDHPKLTAPIFMSHPPKD